MVYITCNHLIKSAMQTYVDNKSAVWTTKYGYSRSRIDRPDNGTSPVVILIRNIEVRPAREAIAAMRNSHVRMGKLQRLSAPLGAN